MDFPVTKQKRVEFLKRPDLQGTYVCGSCSHVFVHASSLNRHRRNRHSGEHSCLLCDYKLLENEDIHIHMKTHHNLFGTIMCTCCNYTFESKSQLHDHMTSMARTGSPGSTMPIAKSDNAPGSLSQAVVQSKTPRVIKTPARPKKKSGSVTPSSASSSSSEAPSRASSPPPHQKISQVTTQTVDDDKEVEFTKLLHDAVAKILDGGEYFGDLLTLPETWEEIVKKATAVVNNNIEEMEAGKKIKQHQSKRFKL
ncbi:hypothetical protein GCK72_019578 [Caenorhabditis remanei]|uniref:C2H2-type domain-containing protein n=1 Tax=Caenorhabditis remanei TaxID=31234 RepID=A0A6A5GEV3_CAERE|nr:hypothetical protein GCK72_019578 [Caenorhabditis remanei]KAF1753022.1 hypothetical protein GCK72_019578 [Caenorhabditis remanei]